MAAAEQHYNGISTKNILFLSDLEPDTDNYQGLERIKKIYDNLASENIHLAIYGGDYSSQTLSKQQIRLKHIRSEAPVARVRAIARLQGDYTLHELLLKMKKDPSKYSKKIQRAIETYFRLEDISVENAYENFKLSWDIHQKKLPNIPIYAILGNHDPQRLGEKIEQLKGVTYVRPLTLYNVFGLTLAGLPSSWASSQDMVDFEGKPGWMAEYYGIFKGRPMTQKDYNKAMTALSWLDKNNPDLLVGHTPPLNIGDGGGQFGDLLQLLHLENRRRTQKKDLVAILNGHVHEDHGIRFLEEDSFPIINAASAGASPDKTGVYLTAAINPQQKRLDKLKLNKIKQEGSTYLQETLQEYERDQNGKLIFVGGSPITDMPPQKPKEERKTKPIHLGGPSISDQLTQRKPQTQLIQDRYNQEIFPFPSQQPKQPVEEVTQA